MKNIFRISDMTDGKRHALQTYLGVVLCLSGIVLLFIGLYCPPIGIIDPTVLTAFGEIGTFGSALIGIDGLLKSRNLKTKLEFDQRISELEADKQQK